MFSVIRGNLGEKKGHHCKRGTIKDMKMKIGEEIR
jgi:hypothetical protein